MSPIDIITHLRALEANMTPAPWHIGQCDETSDAAWIDSADLDSIGLIARREDQAAICDMRNSFRKLLDIVDAAGYIPQKPSSAHRILTPGWDALRAAFSALAPGDPR